MVSYIDITKTKKDNLKHNINNKLKQLKPEEPDSISNIEINDENFMGLGFRVQGDIEKENIVIYKYFNILFLSKKELGKIVYENNKDIFLDATFKSCNKLYSQLLIIRVYNKTYNEFLTIAFIYMTSKSELLYKRVLESFKNFIIETNNLNPNVILFNKAHIDMELALSNAILAKFNNCKINIVIIIQDKLLIDIIMHIQIYLIIIIQLKN